MTEVNNRTRRKIDVRLIKKATEKFLKLRGLAGREVSIALVAGAEMSRLNERWRGRKGTTDVLSFEGEGNFLGEIIIDPAQIEKQSRERGNSFENELIFVLVHGLLHLCGLDDPTEKKRLTMIAEGEEIIKKIIKKRKRIRN